jgi:hypothetical protein
MPYKRRRYGGSKRLSRPAYYFGKYLDMVYRQTEAQKRLGVIQAVANDLNGGGTARMYNPATGGYDQRTQAEVITNLAARGKGSYGFGRVGRALGGMAGAALGSRAAGAAVGGFLGRTGSNMLLGGGGYTAAGSGSYGLSNSLVSGSSVAVPTMMGGDEIGSIVVSHKEYLGNITGSIMFENSAFELNPGLPGTFPWLSQIAQNYEEYSFEQLMFTYTSLLSDSTSSGVIGSIIMTTNYNAGQGDFTNTSDMLNNIGTISARPIDGPIIHGIECDDAKNVLPSYYVRSGSVPDNQDIKTYDMGRFQIATEGMPVDNQLQGQLWVSYAICLRKPKIWTSAGKGILTDVYKYLTTSGIDETYCTGKMLLASPQNNIGTIITNQVSGENMTFRVAFPPTQVQGTFRIEWGWLNPIKLNEGYPPQPLLSPTWSFSNCEIATPVYYSYTAVDDQNLGSNVANQITGYQNWQSGTGHYDPMHRAFIIIRLLGSYAIPTHVDIKYPAYTTGNFTADDFWLNISQINPNIVASFPDNPVGWVPQVVQNAT